jgi:NAD(P)-dependent dehydrogenase (short-subunit alcohol dehydrogenase family)
MSARVAIVTGAGHGIGAAVVAETERRYGGLDVAIAPAAAQRGLWHLAAYGATKHAVVGLVRGLAVDLAGTGVTAVALSPGATDTAMLRATADLYGLPDPGPLTDDHPLGRPLAAAEVAAAASWLCSPGAVGVTGSVVRVDGGFTA